MFVFFLKKKKTNIKNLLFTKKLNITKFI